MTWVLCLCDTNFSVWFTHDLTATWQSQSTLHSLLSNVQYWKLSLFCLRHKIRWMQLMWFIINEANSWPSIGKLQTWEEKVALNFIWIFFFSQEKFLHISSSVFNSPCPFLPLALSSLCTSNNEDIPVILIMPKNGCCNR